MWVAICKSKINYIDIYLIQYFLPASCFDDFDKISSVFLLTLLIIFGQVKSFLSDFGWIVMFNVF